MTKTTMPLSALLEKHDEGDFLCTVAEAVLQLLMETDVEGVIGAGRHERTEGASPTATAIATAGRSLSLVGPASAASTTASLSRHWSERQRRAKTAVDAIFVGRERRYNRRFEQMCGHYLVEPSSLSLGPMARQ